eukprot:1286362-Amphidinium_carterae.2
MSSFRASASITSFRGSVRCSVAQTCRPNKRNCVRHSSVSELMEELRYVKGFFSPTNKLSNAD